MKKFIYLSLFLLLFSSFNSFSQATIWSEDFEAAGTETYTSSTTNLIGLPEWEYSKTDNGRLRLAAGAGFYNGGSNAATLDANPNGTQSVNYLIAEIDLSSYTTSSDINLSFYFTHHGEESHSNDRVFIRGSSSDSWVEIYDWYSNCPSAGTFKSVTNLDIDATLSGAGQVLTSTFQLLFGQQDNYAASSTTANDGFTVDDIIIKGTPVCNTSAYAWTGTINSDWNNTGNWYGGSVPTTTSDVIIPATCVTNWPTLNVDANCQNLTIESGAQLSCSSYNLNVYGDWTNSGTFYEGTGSVYFKGNTDATLTINGNTETIFSEGFETGTTGWSLGSLTGHAEWRRQSGAANTGTWDCALYDVGNSSAHDFPRTGNNGYVDLSRTIDLSDYSSASITYYWRSNGNDRTFPLLNFAGTTLDEDMYGGSTSWHTETYDLSSFCGDYDNYMFFRMWVGSDVGGSAPGLSIDDILITGTLNVQSFNNIYIEKTGGASLILASSV